MEQRPLEGAWLLPKPISPQGEFRTGALWDAPEKCNKTSVEDTQGPLPASRGQNHPSVVHELTARGWGHGAWHLKVKAAGKAAPARRARDSHGAQRSGRIGHLLSWLPCPWLLCGGTGQIAQPPVDPRLQAGPRLQALVWGWVLSFSPAAT